jgi:hypothetical protein
MLRQLSAYGLPGKIRSARQDSAQRRPPAQQQFPELPAEVIAA